MEISSSALVFSAHPKWVVGGLPRLQQNEALQLAGTPI